MKEPISAIKEPAVNFKEKIKQQHLFNYHCSREY